MSVLNERSIVLICQNIKWKQNPKFQFYIKKKKSPHFFENIQENQLFFPPSADHTVHCPPVPVLITASADTR